MPDDLGESQCPNAVLDMIKHGPVTSSSDFSSSVFWNTSKSYRVSSNLRTRGTRFLAKQQWRVSRPNDHIKFWLLVVAHIESGAFSKLPFQLI